MTYVPGPPNVPPYGGPPAGGPPYGGPPHGGVPYGPPYRRPPRSAASTTLLTALAAALFVVATAAAAWGVHHKGARTFAAPTVNGSYAGVSPNPGIPAVAGSSSYPTGSLSTPSVPAPTYTPYTPPAPTPTHQPLDPAAVNRTFQVYMNALLYRSLQQLKSATCPRLQHTETGTALDHKYVNRWQGHEYTIYDSLDYVIIPATVRYVNPRTGGNGASHVYRWYVERYPDGEYWVCGILR